MSIRIAIAEDDPFTREQYAQRFSFFKHITIVAFAENGQELLDKLAVLSPANFPSIVLMDIEMPVLSGIEATAQLKDSFPQTEVMMLTVFRDDEKIFQSVQAGASGYLLKDCSTEELVHSIEELHQGGVPLAKSIARRVLQFMKDSQSGRPSAQREHADDPFQLTAREIEVLELIVQDRKEFAIAEELFISPATVHTHIKNIYRKLQVHSRGGVVRTALHHGLVRDSPAAKPGKR